MKTTLYSNRQTLGFSGLLLCIVGACADVDGQADATNSPSEGTTNSRVVSGDAEAAEGCNNDALAATTRSKSIQLAEPDDRYRAPESAKAQLKAARDVAPNAVTSTPSADLRQRQSEYLSSLEVLRTKHKGDRAKLERARIELKERLLGDPMR